MPELPEVETVVRDLRPLLVGRTIRSVRRSGLRLRKPWKPSWDAVVRNARVASIRRRGKWILVDVNDSSVLRVHLGMTGQFTVVPASDTEPDHLHLRFELDNGAELRYRDPRRFGLAEWFGDRVALAETMDRELGPEPFGVDAGYFRDAMSGASRNLKAILLDQTILAGVGNIYADEALFRARLHPDRRGRSLNAGQCDRLRESIEAVLTRAIEYRGSSIRDYVGGSGLRGGFQNELSVYGRAGEACPECGAGVKCMRLAGRASHFCPRCQKRSPQRHKAHTKTHNGMR
jgi:formamidopyrimidine-DNA glycosylase